MASERTLELKITGDARGLGRAFKQVDRDASKFSRSMDGVRRGMGTMARAAGVATVAVAAAGAAFAKVGLEGAIAQEKLNARTANVLKTMGEGAGRTTKQVEGLATQIERATGSDGQVVQAGANLVLTFGNIKNAAGEGNDVFDRTVRLANDMSVALGQDMSSSSIQLGKALNDPVKGVTALQRVGVSFTAQQKEQIKTLAESGRALDAQKLVLGEVEKQFGGAAAAEGPLTEAWQRLTNTFGEVAEGVMVRVLPALTAAAEFIRVNVIPVIQDMAAVFSEAIGEMIATAEGEVRRVVDIVRENWEQISAKTREVFAEVGETVASVARAIRPVLRELALNIRAQTELILAIWDRFGKHVLRVVVEVFKAIMPIVRPALATLRSVVETVTALIEGDWSKAWQGIQNIVKNAMKTLVAIIRGAGGLVVSAMKFLGQKVYEGATSIPDKLLSAGKAIVNGIVEGIKSAAGQIRDAVVNAVPSVGDVVSGIIGGTRYRPTPNATRVPGSARGALLPGTYQGRDTMIGALAPGEAILTPKQQRLVEGGVPIRTALAMTGGRIGGSGFASGGYVNPVPGGSWSGGPGVGTHSYSAEPNNWQSDNAYDIFPGGSMSVYAAYSGQISRISPFSSDPRFWGYGVYLSGAQGQLYYKHLRSVSVSSGQSVSAGTKLGELGHGVNGGAHLHLGANPLSLLYSAKSGGAPGDVEGDDQTEGPGPSERTAPPPLNDKQKLAQVLGTATGRTGLVGPKPGGGKKISGWAKPLVNTLSTDVPDVSGGLSGTSYSGADSRAISGAGRKARASARAAGESPEEVREKGEEAERQAELKVLRKNRRKVIQARAALRKKKAKLLADWRKLTKKPAKTAAARNARRKSVRLIKGKLREYTAEINDLTEMIAEINERMAELNEAATDEQHAENYEAGQEGEGGEDATDADPGPTELDYIDADIAKAALTDDPADDIAAAERLEAFRQGEYDAAVASGDPRRIAEAARNLKAAQDNTDALKGNTDALKENTDALRGFAGSVTFAYRGQDYVLGSLAPPSSDRIENLGVGV